LTLVSALQDQQFNVFLFDFAGHGNNPAGTTLGYREVGELRAAIQTISARDDVDPTRFGLWGVDMGGYVVLEVATTDPRIKAFIVDDAYSDPRLMVQNEVKRSGLTILPLVDKFSDFGFRMLNYRSKSQPPVTGQLPQTKGVPKLFFVSEDRQVLATETMNLYNRAPDPKQVIRTNVAYSVMSDDSRKNYETQVVGFFLQNLSPTHAAKN
jgi:pimeloyl-ACP methyl ester carboxylesterase